MTIAQPDLWKLYAMMLRSRLFEEAVSELWREGLISGEMHLGVGEEGIIAGIAAHLQEGDALALDHRGTSAMLLRGVDPVLLLKEMLGREDGLCGGWGGHMHLFSRPHLAASSGIVGASGPAGAGFALAAQQLRPGTAAVAFFGEGAMNQGMLLETLNLAAVWRLPLLLVCKDNGWAIATRSPQVTSGDLRERARSFGLPVASVDGRDVAAVWQLAREGLALARAGEGPTFLHATCTHLEGHFLGDLLLRLARREEMPPLWPLLRSAAGREGAGLSERLSGLQQVVALLRQAAGDHEGRENDPLPRARRQLADEARLTDLEQAIVDEVQSVVARALHEEEPAS
ncbi:MAG TPA: thiamine pyrophosphate-dependent dehydrogenase E1 component subunit alpha [Candidatus Sulfomarinibacteraceae bacterium]|nr:thiamine pyrophosphate-dependent dehydrogenase E1 component subunit alpha [Candidatus Sulfomarinibacteraceae bacterium]